MAISEFELHPDRLTTTDEQGRRVFVYPADVQGVFRTRRTQVQIVLMAIFLLLPWFRIHGRQALLLDVASRRFEIFGLSLRAHNAPLLFFVLAMAAFGLFAATAVFGRVWCGWACPQTVFIDGLYRRIERWVEGPAFRRRQLARDPWTLNKAYKKFLKWALYVGVTLILTHSFLAYFVGTEQLALMVRRSPFENWTSFLFMAISSAIILFDFAWFREQFCTIACPYGRFQSVLMDRNSLIVAYDPVRGEPRATPEAKASAKTQHTPLGDCVNCYRCVQVCPTGIDIRRGVQLECIACTACIDACDEVMAKVKKPPGLIRYDSLAGRGHQRKLWTGRSILYTGFVMAAAVGLIVALSFIKPVGVEVFRAKETPYTTQTMADGEVMITNHFKLELSNQSGVDHSLRFAVVGGDPDIQLITATQPLPLVHGKLLQADIFIRFKKSLLTNGQKPIQLMIEDETQPPLKIEKEVSLVGPFS